MGESVHVRSDRTNPVLAALASTRRRVVLAALAEESPPVSVSELATHVAAAVGGTATENVDADARDREHVSLVHRDLPKLADADLVEWDREDAVVTTSDRAALADQSLGSVIDSPTENWDDLLASLAHERRRVVLSVLVDHGSAIGRRELARRTVARERDVPASAVSDDETDDVTASLYHVHLPKLRDAGLLVDDPETIRYDGHPALDEESLLVESSDDTPVMEPVTQ